MAEYDDAFTLATTQTGAPLDDVEAFLAEYVAFPSPDHGKRAQFASSLESDFDRVAVLPGTLGDGAIWIYRSHAR